MNSLSETLRILDAAINRAGEGLRACEDYVRFGLDDPALTTLAKCLRHDLAAATDCLSPHGRLSARETETDVGKRLTVAAEGVRMDASDVCTANLKRSEQALRSIEEYGKLIDAEMVARVEQIRYQTYTLERCIGSHEISQGRLGDSRLYVLIDGRGSDANFASDAKSLIDSGGDLIQLRDKRLTDRELVDRARRLVEVTRGTKTLAIINDRPDIAAAVHADGVHVGQDEMSVKDVRSVVGPNALIGVSTHSKEQVESAVVDGANYLGVGPVFASTTKRFDTLPGLAFVREVVAITRLPWFAIGGIDGDNVPGVLAAGAIRVAVGGAVWNATDPGRAVEEFQERLRAYPKPCRERRLWRSGSNR